MKDDYYTNEKDYRPNEQAFEGTDYRYDEMNRDHDRGQRAGEGMHANRQGRSNAWRPESNYTDYREGERHPRQGAPARHYNPDRTYEGANDFERSSRKKNSSRRDRSGQHFDTDHGRQEFSNWGRSDHYHPGWLPQDQDPFSVGSQFGGSQTRGEQTFNTTADRMYDNRGEYGGLGPKGYKRSPEKIKEEISEALTWNEHIDASEIEISADENGEVTLSGHVSSRRQKRLSEDLAEAVRGVTDIHNQLRVIKQSESSSSEPKASSSKKEKGVH